MDLLGTNTNSIWYIVMKTSEKMGVNNTLDESNIRQCLVNMGVSLPYVALTYVKILSHLCSTYWLQMTFIDKYVESHSLKEKHRYQFYSVNRIYKAVTNL